MAKTLVEVRNPNDPGHITDHELSARLVNELYGVNAYAPVAGATVNPDVALGGVHEITLPVGNVTIGPATSSDPAGGIQRYNPGERVVLVLTQPAAGNATVTWDASWRRTTSGIDPRPNAVTTIEFVNDAAPGLAPQWRPSAIAPTAVESVRVWHTDTANPALVVRAAPAQSSAMTQWQDSTGTVVNSISSGGSLLIPGHLILTSQGELASFGYRAGWDTGGTAYQGLVISGVAPQTADLTQWRDSSGAVKAAISAGGNLLAQNLINPANSGPYVGLEPTRVQVYNQGAVGNVALNVQGMAGQTGDLTQWKDSSGTVLAAVKASGGLWVTSATNPSVVVGNAPNLANGFAFLGHVTTAGTWFTDSAVNEGVISANLTTGKRFRVGKSSGPAGLTPLSLSDEVAQVVAIIKGQASQSGDLTQWQNSAGGVAARVAPDGSFTTTGSIAVGSATAYLNNAHVSLKNVAGDTGSINFATQAIASQSADFAQWLSSAGGQVAAMDAGGGFFATNIYGGVRSSLGAAVQAIAPSAGTFALVAKGAPSQTADLQKWQSSAGADFLRVTSFGSLYVRANAAQGVDAASDMHVNSGGTTDKPLVVRAFAAQTGNLTEWQDSTGAVLASVASLGQMNFTGSAGGYQNIGGGAAALSVRPLGNDPARTAIIMRSAPSQTAVLLSVQNSAGSQLAAWNADGSIGAYSLSCGGIQFAPRNLPFIYMGANQSSDMDNSSIYQKNGALFYRGNNGTITQLAAA